MIDQVGTTMNRMSWAALLGRGIVALALVSATGAALALEKTYNRRVTFNAEHPTIDYIAVDEANTCKSLVSNVKIVAQAKHGRISIKKEIREAVHPARCRGRKFPLYRVVYKPDKDFKGRDEAIVGFQVYFPQFGEKATMNQRYRIRAK